MNTSEILQRNLERARIARGLSCIGLSKLAGLPLSAVGKISRGETPSPGIVSIASIAKALRVSIDWLVSGRGAPK